VTAVPEFRGENLMRIGAVDFHYELPLISERPGHLGIEKTRPLLEDYADLWAGLRPRRVVELGIRRGGSTAMLSELGGAERIVSIELSPNRIEALDRYIDEQGVADVVRPHFGVDQADRARLRRIVDEEFAGQPLDLVIDDASHLYAESRASFEVLFPHLRPGGLYLLEDWRWQHIFGAGIVAALEGDDPARRDHVQREVQRRMVEQHRTEPATPMSRLVVELVLARAVSGDVAQDIEIRDHWAAVRRGPAALDQDTFRLDDHAPDLFHVLPQVS